MRRFVSTRIMVTPEEVSVVSALAAGAVISSIAGAHQQNDQIAVCAVI
jgi:hypothetical protein